MYIYIASLRAQTKHKLILVSRILCSFKLLSPGLPAFTSEAVTRRLGRLGGEASQLVLCLHVFALSVRLFVLLP